MVTWSSYTPGAVNVAVVLLAAFVPLDEKATGPGTLPVAAQV